MKIIISHDVDHIYSKDHLFKDLILEKMALRGAAQLLHKQIGLKTFIYRCFIVFRKRMNRIDEVMKFDKEHHVPSIFFFGMDNVLGMSYSKKNAQIYIKKVLDNGFDVGVHGCDYLNEYQIKKEHDDFKQLSGRENFGIRNHYVRFDNETFAKMNKAGYLFDSTYFNKDKTELVNPYKVGNMWEFPLHIMDVYVCKQGALEAGLKSTFSIIREAERRNLKYCTILFHDYQFDKTFDPDRMEWYIRTIEFCEKSGYEFISYRDAIEELEYEHN